MTDAYRDALTRHMDSRRDELGITWDQVAAKGSTHAETLRQVRKHRRAITGQTKRAIEIGLDWRTGSVDRILTGGDPEPLPAGTADLPGLPKGELLSQLDWVRRQPWSATDKRRIASWLIELDELSAEDRAVS